MSTKSVEEKTCPHCGHVSRRYKISFSSLHVRLARIVFEYCVQNKTNAITKKEISHLLSHTDYGNFYILQRFGLLYYIEDDNGKRIKGSWGVALRRLRDFLDNKWKVAEYFWRDKDERSNSHSERRIFLREIQKHEQWIDPVTMLPTFLAFEEDIQNGDNGEYADEDPSYLEGVDYSKKL